MKHPCIHLVKSNHPPRYMRMHHFNPEHQGACMCPKSAGYGPMLIRATPPGPLTFCLDQALQRPPKDAAERGL